MNISYRNFIILALMLATSGLVLAMKPREKIADHGPKVDLETMIPKQFVDWSFDPTVIPVIPSPDVQANLSRTYDQVLSRTYINSKGERIMLSITYGSSQTQDLKAHRQEVCYKAQGFNIESVSHHLLRILNHPVSVTRMYATLGDRSEPVTYWFTMGDKVVLSRTERFLVQLKYSFSGQIPDGFLVRVSSISSDTDVAYQQHQKFISDLISSSSPIITNRLLGSLG